MTPPPCHLLSGLSACLPKSGSPLALGVSLRSIPFQARFQNTSRNLPERISARRRGRATPATIAALCEPAGRATSLIKRVATTALDKACEALACHWTSSLVLVSLCQLPIFFSLLHLVISYHSDMEPWTQGAATNTMAPAPFDDDLSHVVPSPTPCHAMRGYVRSGD